MSEGNNRNVSFKDSLDLILRLVALMVIVLGLRAFLDQTYVKQSDYEALKRQVDELNTHAIRNGQAAIITNNTDWKDGQGKSTITMEKDKTLSAAPAQMNQRPEQVWRILRFDP